MIVIGILLLISFVYIKSFSGPEFSFKFIEEKNPHLLSPSYIPSYTAGLTFFIAVAATNLFHQGNWQRVYAAKNFETLRKSLIISFFIIVPVVFYMGFTGMVAFSLDPTIRPDLGFFTLLLKEQSDLLSLFVIVLGLALTISTVDTLVNAISSLIVVDGKATFSLKKTNYLNFSKYLILFLSLICFIIASKGFDILYLFLLADLFCCAFVLTVFYSFYNKNINEKTAYVSIMIGLIGGFLMFPSPDFSKSLLVGIIMPKELFAPFVSQSLLFLSFVVATFLPLVVFKAKKF
jgi:Na+/proline symporter